MQQLEKMLDEWLVKKAPFQIPEAGRKGVVEAMPYVALVGGAFMVLFAWMAYQTITSVDYGLINLANNIGRAYGADYVSPIGSNPFVWVSLALLVVEAVLLFMAYSGLREHKKKAWDLLFWVTLANVLQALVHIFAYSTIGTLLGSAIGTVVGLYVLFQIRSYYTGVTVASGASPTMKTPKETPVKKGTPPKA